MTRPPSPLYFDNNATTALDPAVLAAMEPYLTLQFANPSSPYTFARAASLAVLQARERVAALIGASSGEIVFTSGGTESNALALHGALALRPDRRHIVTTAVEHASVRAFVDDAEQRGYRVTRVAVDGMGRLDEPALREAITQDTALVSVMAANNETGVVWPVAASAAAARARGALFHADAVQAAGKIAFDVRDAGADLVALCAHKLHGPKGVGALYVREGLDLPPMLRGGEQEQGRRAGTENVPGIVGFGRAAELAGTLRDADAPRIRDLRDTLEQRLLSALPGTRVVAAAAARLPNTSLFLFPAVETEALLARLDLAGVCCSSGSACASGAHEPSHVLQAMGLHDRSLGVVRVSLSRFSTAAEVESLVDAVVGSVHGLRSFGASAERPRT